MYEEKKQQRITDVNFISFSYPFNKFIENHNFFYSKLSFIKFSGASFSPLVLDASTISSHAHFNSPWHWIGKIPPVFLTHFTPNFLESLDCFFSCGAIVFLDLALSIAKPIFNGIHVRRISWPLDGLNTLILKKIKKDDFKNWFRDGYRILQI